MRAVDVMRKEVVTVSPDATLRSVSELMDANAVGAVVVADHDRAVGIVTDRDVVVRGVARGLPTDARIDSVMSAPVVTLAADADVRSALPLFREHAFRRLPLVEDDRVIGMVTVDDLLVDVIADLGDLARPITGEVVFGHPEPKLPAVAD